VCCLHRCLSVFACLTACARCKTVFSKTPQTTRHHYRHHHQPLRSYIQAAGGALPAWRNKFAYPLMWNVSGSLHNHVVAWKVDLDVAGRSNSVNMHQIGVQKSETPGMGMPIWSYK
jgi:hypothetical protein